MYICYHCFIIYLEDNVDPQSCVRTLQNFNVWVIDPFANPIPAYDGAVVPPSYTPPKYLGPDIRTEAEKEELKLYTGSCHCGAVTVAVKLKPIEEIKVNEDD